MVLQLPGSQLIRLLAQLTDERHHQPASNTRNPPQLTPCGCGCGHDFAEMADLRVRFVPPRLDL